MPPPTPEQRFEVPPEYAEVYERAYRRAYEEGQGQLSPGETADPVRRLRGRRGSHASRTSHRAVGQPRASQWAQPWPGQHLEGSEPDHAHSTDDPPTGATPEQTGPRPPGKHATPLGMVDHADAPSTASGPAPDTTTHEEADPAPEEPQPRSRREPVPVVVVNPDALRPAHERHGHRAERRARRSSVASVLGLGVLALALLAGAFVLGRLSVGRVDLPGVPGAAPPAVRTSVSVTPALPARAVETGLAGLQAALEPPGPYRGPVSRLGGARAEATCAAPADRDASGRRVSYAPRNVLDGVAETAWLCKGSAVGQRLTITLPVTADVVRVGLVPGYAKSDRYPQNNRVTRVAWVFDDGTRVVQALGDSRTDRSLRTLRIEPVRTRTVVLEILSLAKGARNNTAISAIRLDTFSAASGGG